MARAFLLSLLIQKHAELGEAFLHQFAHSWLVWDAETWSAPSRDGATRIISASGVAKPTSEATESLCYALTTRPGKSALHVGRASELDVVINDGTVSRQHAVLSLDPKARWVLQVVTSNARTLHQDRALGRGEEVVLSDGDRVEFGDVRLRYLTSETLHWMVGKRLAGAASR